MIREKCIDKIIAIIMVIAVLFTISIAYLPEEILSKVVANKETSAYVTEIFNQDKIITIDIQMDEKDWDTMLENSLVEEYSACNVTVNGVTYYNVGIRPKGNTSLTQIASDDTTDRYSFKLDFDKYISGQNCEGLDKLVLNNIMSDSTYMKEYFSYEVLTYIGVPSSLYNFADVSVNGKTWGFYFALEGMEESFAERVFGEDYGELYKPESDRMGGGGGKGQREERQVKADKEVTEDMQFNRSNIGESSNGADLEYNNDNSDSYSDIFSNSVFDTNEEDYQRVIEALKNLNDGTELEKYINVDECLRYFAANAVLVNQDSYFGTMLHNYYLYEENGQLSMLPWDYNLAFGGFQGKDASSAVNQPIDPPVYGADIEDRPIIKELLEVEEYNNGYHQYLQEIIEGYFESGLFEQTWNKVKAQISDYVKNDPTAFYTYEEFEEGTQTLFEFINLRIQSVKGQLDGTIPSTSEGQQENSQTLVVADNINLSTMGTQGGGKGGGMDFPGGFEKDGEKAVMNQQGEQLEPMPEMGEEVVSGASIRQNGNRMGEEVVSGAGIRQNGNRMGREHFGGNMGEPLQSTNNFMQIASIIGSFFIIMFFLVFLKFYKRRKYCI